MDIRISNEEKITVTLAPKTAAGNPARVDGIPQWSVISGSSTVEPAADGMSAVLISGSVAETTQIDVTADADLSGEIRNIGDTIMLIVSEPEATNLGLVVGTPEPK